jgi:hypothetical protein
VRAYYYACGGYVGKGRAVCQRAVIPREWIEAWVLEQIGGIVRDLLENGGEKKLRKMIEQELAGVGRSDGSELAALRRYISDSGHHIRQAHQGQLKAGADVLDCLRGMVGRAGWKR